MSCQKCNLPSVICDECLEKLHSFSTKLKERRAELALHPKVICPFCQTIIDDVKLFMQPWPDITKTNCLKCRYEIIKRTTADAGIQYWYQFQDVVYSEEEFLRLCNLKAFL